MAGILKLINVEKKDRKYY